MLPIYRLNEILLALLGLWWSVILLLPGDLFAGIERYRAVGQYAGDAWWGVFLLVFSLPTLVARPLWLRKQAHAALCIIWLGLFALVMLSTPSKSTLLIASLVFVISAVHALKFWRLSHPP